MGWIRWSRRSLWGRCLREPRGKGIMIKDNRKRKVKNKIEIVATVCFYFRVCMRFAIRRHQFKMNLKEDFVS